MWENEETVHRHFSQILSKIMITDWGGDQIPEKVRIGRQKDLTRNRDVAGLS